MEANFIFKEISYSIEELQVLSNLLEFLFKTSIKLFFSTIY